MLNEEFKTYPAVYAVGDEYRIVAVTVRETLMWVQVGEERFYDHSNGVIRSASAVHKMTVPMALLDAAGGYTICYRNVIERKPYYSETEDVKKAGFAFRAVNRGEISIYHISDAHNKVDSPVHAAELCGRRIDLLVLNGDIPNDSGDVRNFDAIHEIAGRVTRGEIPTVFSRGNHDMRGIYAEKLAEYTPTDGGNSYFTFRLGELWGLVLDCGEDKPDGGIEYGNTVCCGDFRRRETHFIENVIKNKACEYMADGVKKRMVICHIPFTYIQKPPFDIEQELYAYWTKLLREEIKPDFILCGHIHKTAVWYPGGEHDSHGQGCPVIIGADPHLVEKDRDIYDGCAIIYGDSSVKVEFTDQDGVIKRSESFET